MPRDSSTYFHAFSKSIDKIELPRSFTFPFYYIPHPLVELAAAQLQEYISEHSELASQFDLASEKAIGKMFGVLVVQSEEGEIGFLSAFSGRLSDSYIIDGFVPPLYDNAAEDSFYRIEENNISNLTIKLSKLESDTEFITAQDRLQEAEGKREQAILSAKAEFSIARKERRKLRASAKLNLSEEGLHHFA